MAGTRVRHAVELPVSAETYWAVRNTPEFMKIENAVLKQDRAMVEEVKDAAGWPVSAKVRTVPELHDIPDALLAFAPQDGIVFTDTVKYIRTTRTKYAFDAVTTPNVFANKSKISARIEIVPSADGSEKCTHIIDVVINFDDVFLIGGLIESVAADRLRKSHMRLPQIVRKWMETSNYQAPGGKAVEGAPAGEGVAEVVAVAGEEQPVLVEEDVLWVASGYQAWQMVLVGIACFAVGVQVGRMFRK